MRADVYLTRGGWAASREQAKKYIEAGIVLCGGVPIEKPAQDVPEDADIEVVGRICPYVSRGGLKLEAALERFHIDLNNKSVIDIGASTGGFTDCALKHGAASVRAIDCGCGQLHDTLKNDPRVVSYEKMNARYIKPEDIGGRAEIITLDVSFISQTLLFPALYGLLYDKGLLISLIKPQFEAGKRGVGKGGIVKDASLRAECVKRVTEQAALNGFGCISVTESPIRGGDGNHEYIALFEKLPREGTENVV